MPISLPPTQPVNKCYMIVMASAAPTVSRASNTQHTQCHIKFTAYYRIVGPMFTIAFIKKVMPKIKHLVPDVSTVHYLTDSPTSQYWNKHIIHLTAQHENLFSVEATWQYFEVGQRAS